MSRQRRASRGTRLVRIAMNDDETDDIARIRDAMSASRDNMERVLAKSEALLQRCPWSSEAAVLRGDVLCYYLAMDDASASEEALKLYTLATELDPNSGEAWEGLAYCLDTYYDDFAQAEEAFRRAVALDAGADSYVGLARVLAQMGNRESALETVEQGVALHGPTERLVTVRRDIDEGRWDPLPDDDEQTAGCGPARSTPIAALV